MFKVGDLIFEVYPESDGKFYSDIKDRNYSTQYKIVDIRDKKYYCQYYFYLESAKTIKKETAIFTEQMKLVPNSAVHRELTFYQEVENKYNIQEVERETNKTIIDKAIEQGMDVTTKGILNIFNKGIDIIFSGVINKKDE